MTWRQRLGLWLLGDTYLETELMRRILDGRGERDDFRLIDEMEGQVAREFNESARRVLNEKAYRLLSDRIVEGQKDFSLRQSQVDLHLTFSRGTVNGIDLLEEQLKHYSLRAMNDLNED